MDSVKGIRPLHFVHILDLNSNVTRVESGPMQLVLQTNEKLICGPLPFIVVPPTQYCIIKNPCKKYVPGEPVELACGQFDVRYHCEPFFLYPGEELRGAETFAKTNGAIDYKAAIKPLPIVKANTALRLKAVLDHEDVGVQRMAGDLWQLEGPLTYLPSPNAEILEHVQAVIIKDGQALRLVATQACRDRQGNQRVTGEEWLETTPGAYVPGVFEKVVTLDKPYALTPEVALMCRAKQTVTDSTGNKRQAGDEWLITSKDTDTYIAPVGVEVVQSVKLTVLTKRQYCVILDPVDAKGRPQLGKSELRVGVRRFFLHPGERMKEGIQNAHLLAAEEALVLSAADDFEETCGKDKIKHLAGERWMIVGPQQYIPSVQVNIIAERRAIPLSKNEGIYIQDIQTGAVRAVMGPQSYMLTAYEELWEKQLTDQVEILLRKGGGDGDADIRKVAYFEQSIDPALVKGRDKTRVVAYRCPGNTACQVYNYRDKTARVIFGPDLVVLGPHEDFCVHSLSAGKPKKPFALKTFCLMLGPDFITDIIVVETSDHARLKIQLAFNNHFEVDKTDPDSSETIFRIPDFIGYACHQIGSRIRAAVAQVSFDDFHRHSSQVIQNAVFGAHKVDEPFKPLKFEANNLVITSVDIQSIEPVDAKMSESLMKSVQMAIEIATNSIEATASHEAARQEQVARGRLDRQRLQNEREAELERAKLLELQAVTAAVESTGQAVAEAKASAEKLRIECESEIEAARLKAEAEYIEHSAKLEVQQMTNEAEISYVRDTNKQEVHRNRALTAIEVAKFQNMVNVLGSDTISAIAMAGPAANVKLLKGLGIQSMLVTDGNSPINMFSTARGLIGSSH